MLHTLTSGHISLTEVTCLHLNVPWFSIPCYNISFRHEWICRYIYNQAVGHIMWMHYKCLNMPFKCRQHYNVSLSKYWTNCRLIVYIPHKCQGNTMVSLKVPPSSHHTNVHSILPFFQNNATFNIALQTSSMKPNTFKQISLSKPTNDLIHFMANRLIYSFFYRKCIFILLRRW